jgi:hypothetical protein
MKIKKTYCSPKILVTSLDRHISLSMVTEYTPPDDPFGTSAQPAQEVETEKSSFEENPFKR